VLRLIACSRHSAAKLTSSSCQATINLSFESKMLLSCHGMVPSTTMPFYLLPMCPDQPVTYVPGSHTSLSAPGGGEGRGEVGRRAELRQRALRPSCYFRGSEAIQRHAMCRWLWIASSAMPPRNDAVRTIPSKPDTLWRGKRGLDTAAPGAQRNIPFAARGGARAGRVGHHRGAPLYSAAYGARPSQAPSSGQPMLLGLTIRDVVLIERLDLAFHAGLCVLTGETGAGKSILLDA